MFLPKVLRGLRLAIQTRIRCAPPRCPKDRSRGLPPDGPAIQTGGLHADRARTGDLGPGRTGPTPAEQPGRSASVKVAQGKGTWRETDGELDRTAADEGAEPENAGRGKPRKADEGDEPGRANGKPEESPDGNRTTPDEAPNHPVRVRGFGAAPYGGAVGRVPAWSARTAYRLSAAGWATGRR